MIEKIRDAFLKLLVPKNIVNFSIIPRLLTAAIMSSSKIEWSLRKNFLAASHQELMATTVMKPSESA